MVVPVVVVVENIKLAVVVVVVDETFELAETLHGRRRGPGLTCHSAIEFDRCRPSDRVVVAEKLYK